MSEATASPPVATAQPKAPPQGGSGTAKPKAAKPNQPPLTQPRGAVGGWPASEDQPDPTRGQLFAAHVRQIADSQFEFLRLSVAAGPSSEGAKQANHDVEEAMDRLAKLVDEADDE